MNAMPVCERCKNEQAARHVNEPRLIWLCWDCFDEWRKLYFGPAYVHCIPIMELKKLYAHIT